MWLFTRYATKRVAIFFSRLNGDNIFIEWFHDVSSNIDYIGRYLGLFPGILYLCNYYGNATILSIAFDIELILLLLLAVVSVNNFLDKFEKYRIKIVKSNDRLNKRELTFQLTLIPLAISGFKYLVYGGFILASLAILDVDIVPIINAAGIGLVVISFFFKSIFEDIIASAFIFIEGKFFYGNYIRVPPYEGKVVKITWSSTYLEKDGKVTIINNRTISNVIILKDIEE